MFTVEFIKQYGTYNGYCDLHKAYIYVVNEMRYAWNGQGLKRI